MDVCRQLFPVGEGSHATPSEVSVTYFGYPQAVKSVAMTPRIAPNGPILDADDYRRRFPDGRIGSDPSQASIAAGEKIVAAAVKGRDFRVQKLCGELTAGLCCPFPGVRRPLERVKPLRPQWCGSLRT